MPAVALIDSEGLVIKLWHENQIPDQIELIQAVFDIFCVVAILDSEGLVVRRWRKNQTPDREELRQMVQEIIDREKELAK